MGAQTKNQPTAVAAAKTENMSEGVASQIGAARCADLLEKAGTMKDQGNKCFGTGKLAKAITWYMDALRTLQEKDACGNRANAAQDFENADEDIKSKRNTMIGVVRANLSMVAIRKEMWRDARKHAALGCEADPANPKVWYRRALACDRINEFDECLEALDTLDKMEQDVIEKAEIDKLREQAKECAQELEDDLDGKMMEQKKKDFDMVCDKYDLRGPENSGKLADLIVSVSDIQCGGDVVKKITKEFEDMEEEDAHKLMAWICCGITFKEQAARAAEAAGLKTEEDKKKFIEEQTGKKLNLGK